MRFSQRHGLTPIKDTIQRESMDDDLRTGLWNVLDAWVFASMRNDYLRYVAGGVQFATWVWTDFFKNTLDSAPDHGSPFVRTVRQFFFSCQWFEAYDFIEFVAAHVGGMFVDQDEFTKAINVTLEREFSAWRLINGRIVEISAPEEVAEVNAALVDPSAAVRTHVTAALDLLSDRKSPNYRNSIKESISAVEAVVNDINGASGTLGTALKKLGVNAHPALENALSKLYGYTSDADGIRHALMDEPNLESEDARFMLVVCSAFVNYLREKARRAGVKT